jgi:hypothetical protein
MLSPGGWVRMAARTLQTTSPDEGGALAHLRGDCQRLFLAEDHWTEQRFEPGETAATGTGRERSRRRDRYHRIQVLNRILSLYGLRLDDWQSRSYILGDRKGKTVLVQDLGALWSAAQQLA